MIPTILLAATLTFHLPTYDADTTSCSESAVLCTDLDSLFVYEQVRFNPRAVLIYRARVAGLQGVQQTIPISAPGDSAASVWTVVTDTHRNRSCPSHVVGLNIPPISGVPAPEGLPSLVEWFDVVGRKVERPSAPGVYWRREVGKIERVLVVR